MGKKSDVFKCMKCNKIVAILQEGEGELVCCGEKMINVTPDEGKRLIHEFQRPGTP
jgi:desulfoferrodoxin-like iron-binding protein